MKLLSVELHGFRRFKKKTKMLLDGKLIAIIGSNEAGKSSFLEALQRLNNSDKFITSGGNQEITRGETYSDDHIVISAIYLVEDDDRNAISHLDDSAKIRYFKWQKKADGKYFWNALPNPTRDIRRRQSVIVKLQSISPKVEKLLKGDLLSESFKEQNEIILTENVIENLCKLLEVKDNQLNQNTLNEINKIIVFFENEEIKANLKQVSQIANELENIRNIEKEDAHRSICSILSERKPKFVFFSEENRNLKSSYALGQLESNTHKALENLLKVAKLDLQKLIGFIKENDIGQKEKLLESVNARLKEFFLSNWNQSKVWVRIAADETKLSILAGEENAVSYVNIDERSDGLRQFIALVTFLSFENYEEPPILLIDEAETHLHYDAQADLIQMLARQNITSQVIYTTHSMGCLPEDLGNGVRLIKQVNENSEIQNWFWDSNEAGFSPVLFGMGATNLAFFPIRFAVVVEGASDIIILPRLLRETIKKDFLGFQIVPGISEATKNTISKLDKHGHRTVYLTDADKGGKELQSKLKSAGIPKSKIFQLPDNRNLGLVLEDFLDIEVYVNGINEELRRSHGDKYKVSVSDIDLPNRPEALNQWCQQQNIPTPTKRGIAYRVIENDADKPIFNSKLKNGLVKLYQNIVEELNKEN